jgi:hypothetical protein
MTTYLCKRDNIEFYELEDLCESCDMAKVKETEGGKELLVCIGEFREVLR